ncbi:hypothetical protein FQN50_000105 [Emmonsiellopsis sp. PD_5]|nr:hypothetical protein FQN50_000105 [Emmonsiellopsis sp. PD_5]
MSLSSQGKKAAQPRQIRFVSADGQPQTKRRRVTAACRTCRKRKIRCSGEQPVCKTCSDYGHNCLGYKDPLESQNAPKGRHPPSSATSFPNRENGKDSSPQIFKSESPSNTSGKASVRSNHNTLSTPRGEAPRHDAPPEAAVIASPESSRSSLLGNNRTHVPYFRYFGPTAIVPGFKQMVVRVREPRQSNNSVSNESLSSVRSPKISNTVGPTSLVLGDSRPSHSIPFYDQDDSLPVSGLISHLCEVFFTHLGCNFPFLQRDRFLRDLKEKRVEPILVDAVCALAARFSLHPLLTALQSQDIESVPRNNERKHAHQGQPFAQRAMCAVVDALSFPTLAVVQACLLLAYEEFGSNHDSGLWMYLGISIRMAQDLGMQKLEGMKFKYGRIGLTPKRVISGQGSKYDEARLERAMDPPSVLDEDGGGTTSVDRARERERVDSFWSIFFLDRVISSGTGRPVTLRDDDIETCFPLQSESALPNGWPGPFPPLMRIIHLYGRITDLLNAIKEVNHVTPDTLKRLAGMESDLTGIYQRLSLKLHFNAANFQDYVKAGEGTNFILLHFWFHTLIVLLHQPTLLHSFGGRIQQLFPNSRELSMSSAKTIADILAFAELIDAKSYIGNPFTSQPIYIAACAFLMESAFYSLPSSRNQSPPSSSSGSHTTVKFALPAVETSGPSDRSNSAKHTLLATAAKENYQRCYKALKSLEVYWEGIGYILTVLDQKAKGIWDPLLYTEEEMDGATEPRPLTSGMAPPGWKRTMTRHNSPEPPSKPTDTSNETSVQRPQSPTASGGSPKMDPSQAIGWALTGAINSSQPNLSFLYQLPTAQSNSVLRESATYTPQYRDPYQPVPPQNHSSPHVVHPYTQIKSQYSPNNEVITTTQNHGHTLSPPPNSEVHSNNLSSNQPYHLSGSSNLHGPSLHTSNSSGSFQGHIGPGHLNRDPPPPYNYNVPHTVTRLAQGEHHPVSSNQPIENPNLGGNNEIMAIESQDIDMNALQDQDSFPFSFDGDFMPWLEYLPQDVLSYFGDHQGYRPMMQHPGDGEEQPPPSV